MSHFILPYIRFGRQCSGTTNGGDYYAILSCSPEIPDSAVEAFLRDVSKSVQWDTTGNEEKYPACFLLWRVTEFSFLFARLCDAGRDSRNRPHAMEITALFLDERFLAALPDDVASFFTSLVQNPIWHNDFHGTTCELFHEPEHETTMESLENKISAFINTPPEAVAKSLFIASHPHFISRGVDAVFYTCDNFKKRDIVSNGPPQPKNSATPYLPPPLMPCEPVQARKTSKGRALRTTFFVMFIVALFLSVLLLGVFACVTYSQNNTLAEELQGTKRKHKQETQLLKDQLDAYKHEMKAKDRELENAQRNSTNAEKRLAKLQEQLTQSRHDANKELSEQYDELKTRYDNFHKETSQLIEKWSPTQHKISPGT